LAWNLAHLVAAGWRQLSRWAFEITTWKSFGGNENAFQQCVQNTANSKSNLGVIA
jgi:hypothetical protein